jgi:hypothetical protein
MLRPLVVLAVATAALVVPQSASAAVPVGKAERVLRELVIPERAPDAFPDATTVNCVRADRALTCDIFTGTLDGDILWSGIANVRGDVWRLFEERYRYRIKGSKSTCDYPSTSEPCDVSSFTWKGRGCGYVTNGVKREGEGSASSIHAVGLRCKPARRVARACVRGKRKGWKAEPTPLGRNALSDGDRRVSFLLVGGGGCGST